MSTGLFVLFLAYMPIVSASLRALDCIDPVAGLRYLRSDLRVECGVGQHAAARALAFTVLVALGVGFPAGLAWLLGTARNEQLVDPAFHATWGFLFDGYRSPTRCLATSPLAATSSDAKGANHMLHGARGPPVVPAIALPSDPSCAGGNKQIPLGKAVVFIGTSTPAPTTGTARRVQRRSTLMPERLTQSWVVSGDSRVWWEAIVLCRKAGVVLLAVTLTNPYLQCVGATLWFLAATALQVRYSPYTKPLFNRLEVASLVTTLLTAIISTALLQYNVGVTSADLHPPDAMTGIEWTVTIALGVLNVGTFVVLAGLWLYLQCARARGIVRRTSFVSAVSGRVTGLRASLSSRRRISAAATGTGTAGTTARPHQFTADDPAGGASDMGGDAAATSIMNPLRLRVEAPLSTPAPAAVSRVKVAFPAATIDAGTNGTHAVPPPTAVNHVGGGDTASEDASGDTGTVPHDISGELPVRAASHHVTIPPPTRGVAFAATPASRSRRKP